MNLGYSTLLGDLIAAQDIQYGDCQTFQIVCPHCREPVFKVGRATDGGTIHYLSHYAADAAYSGDCELRVTAGYGADRVSRENQASREQRLVYFLSVLQKMIGDHTCYSAAGPSRSQALLNRSKVFRVIRDHQFSLMCKVFREHSLFAEGAAGYLKDLSETGSPLTTSFALSVQERIAYDIWLSVLSLKGRRNFDFLCNHAVVQLMSRFAAAKSVRLLQEGEEKLLYFISKMMQSSKNGGLGLLNEMGSIPVGPPFAEPGMDLQRKFFAEVTHEMIGTILCLPYFEYLRKGRSV